MGDLQQASPIPTNVPSGIVTEWGVDDVRNWLLQSMQLPQYLEQFEGTDAPPRERGFLVVRVFARSGVVLIVFRKRDCGGCFSPFGS
jgi:hypothetical protein